MKHQGGWQGKISLRLLRHHRHRHQQHDDDSSQISRHWALMTVYIDIIGSHVQTDKMDLM